MVTGDMPTISDASHSHTVYGLNNLAMPLSTFTGTAIPTAAGQMFLGNVQQLGGMRHQALSEGFATAGLAVGGKPMPKPKPKKEEALVTRRLVQVFIADPDENLPIDLSLLYSGTQKFTDSTDQELFFEIDMKDILQRHNEQRTKTVNKKVKDRTEYLEPAKIRDLKMVVVNVATF